MHVCTDPLKISTIERCITSTTIAVENIHIPVNSELNTIFNEDDTSVCTTCTELSETSCDTIENAQNDNSSLDGEDTIRDIESHLIYHEEKDVTYMVPLPKMGTPRDSSLTPISIMVVDTIGLKKSRALLKVLFDPGSTKTMISKNVYLEELV